MIKKLTKHGNSLALIIEKPILELLGWRESQQVKITTNGKNLVISPAPEHHFDSPHCGCSQCKST